jgi:RNA polymerase sigma-70 factor (ECF subfamily)
LRQERSKDLARKQAALERLYETHYERVARYIAAHIGSISDAEDLASEVFVKALRALDAYQETEVPMEVWLFKISRNIAIDHLRKKGRRPTVPLDESLPVASRDDPAKDLERKQEIEQFNQAVRRLSEAQRQVLALRFGAEMTSEQVATVLGKSAGAVREMQSAAIKKLREILKGQR